MNFDRHCTSPARLSILVSLVPGEALSFTELKKGTGLADGNLHVQTRKLIETGYISFRKEQHGKRSVTRFRITATGLLALRLHSRMLQRVLEGGRAAIEPRSRSRDPGSDDSQVW